MQHQYIAYNGVMPTSASFLGVNTGITIKSLLQVATPITRGIKVIEWGISFDGTVANTPGVVELIQTNVTATLTAGVTPTIWGWPNAPASLCVPGTSATGHTASTEGTITSTQIYDAQYISPTSQYIKQFPLGREPWIDKSSFLRIRVKFGTAVNAICYIIWEE